MHMIAMQAVNDHLPLGVTLMGYGMAGVFSVILLLMLAIKLLTRVLPDKSERDGRE